MSENIKNTFHKGMIKDISDSNKEPSSFEDGFNIRLNSNDSDSEHVVVNIKGNKFSFSIPDIPNILTITPDTIPDSWSDTSIVYYDGGNVVGTPISDANVSPDALMDEIEESLRTDTAFSSLGLNVARNGNIIRVWSTTVNILDYNTGSSLIETVLQTEQPDQIPIGWTRIDDDIYIASTNVQSITGGIMGWYRVTYDRVSLVPEITLIYSDDLKMSTAYPIANPGGIESVKETPTIIRSYWTDRFNDLRSINFADPNIMAVTPDQLVITPIVNLKKPTLKTIQNGGSLITGHYQVAYALGTRGGGLTNYSHTSNSIYINEDSLSNGYTEYQGNESGVITAKSFTIRITEIDTSFDFIEVVVIRIEAADTSPIISKVAELSINSEELEYTHTGSEPASIITENAFNRKINLFDKCHTIAQKDNILFAANTEGDPFNVDFDARAYRFDENGDTVLNDVNQIGVTYPAATVPSMLLTSFVLDETEDTINPEQTIYKYQADGETLGGQGPNISYKFITKSINTDARTDPAWVYPYRIPWEIPTGNPVDLGDGVLYVRGGHWGDMKSPYMDHFLRSYRRGETYRFSWVPVKNTEEGYAKWIADIRFPEMFEEYNVGTTLDDPLNEGKIFPTTDEAYPGKWSVNLMGVEFTVNIPPEIADEITGWRIKRVKLEPAQRTVLAQGIIHPTMHDGDQPTPHPYMMAMGGDMGGTAFTLNGGHSSTYNQLVWNTETDDNGDNYRVTNEILSFHSPDFLFGRPLEHKDGDKLRIQAGVAVTHSTLTYNGVLGRMEAVAPAHNTVLWKNYQCVPIESLMRNSSEFEVQDGISIDHDEDLVFAGEHVENRSTYVPGYDGRRARGAATSLVKLDRGIEEMYDTDVSGTGLTFTNSGTMNRKPDSSMVLANYVRENTGQYGGQHYSARAANVYINTGCDIVGGDLSRTVEVFGGDTFVNIFDSLKMTKNFDPEELGMGNTNLNNRHGRERMAIGMYFPTESFVNTDLREGYSLQGDFNNSDYFYGAEDLVPDEEEFGLDYGEDFKYNYMFSEQMSTQRSFPVPINVIPELIHPVRIWASAPKIYGELSDSWRIFDSETYIDIQGDLGEIRQLAKTNDQLVAWQQRGFGVASVNDRSLVNDTTGSGVVLGQSGVLPRFDYISEDIGSWHQFSFIKSPSGTLFFDAKDGGLYLFNSQGLKDITTDKIKGWLYENTRGNILKNDSPLTNSIGACGTYDTRNKEFLITFYDATDSAHSETPIENSFTIGYNASRDRFTGFKGFKPTMYINDDKYVLTANPNAESNLYLHDIGERGVFYDEDPQESSITITVNPVSEVTKVFDNTEWLTEVYNTNNVEQNADTFDNITSYNSYQSTGIRTDIKRILRKWVHAITYQVGTRNRIRSNWMKQKFSFLNNNDKEFKLHHIINYFRRFPN